ncbi:hypothetical protein GDO81_007517 [Engystomops pustulosus]|uniref:Uncharacterized protein n=1 Tax=Engystomops pustulosus TaxID=76066 RepID=A0AAV7C7N7_ENGPU|nr:hypothetical protein GDO81_007517 [Engystomops pustulosus]
MNTVLIQSRISTRAQIASGSSANRFFFFFFNPIHTIMTCALTNNNSWNQWEGKGSDRNVLLKTQIFFTFSIDQDCLFLTINFNVVGFPFFFLGHFCP